ncbi:MAG: nitrate/nitrite transporter NrtS [Tepidiformaceae bacterium]
MVAVAATAETFCVAGGHPATRLFRFVAGSQPVEKCLRHSIVHRPLMRTAITTALVVGTILTAINQGNILLDGRFPSELYWKIPLTYSIPCMVSTWAALRISLVRFR